MLEARLPGVQFESRAQPVNEGLSRMDIAAFVGFATNGPVNLPVAVDEVSRFRDVFGPDPELAWDADAGQVRYGSLGGCVESFFANGGRRCWIVRAADVASISHHRFELPGMAQGNGDGTASDGVEARARAPGSWCEALSVGTSLARDLIAVRDFELEDETALNPGPVALEAGGYRLDLLADPGDFEPGELIEVLFAEDLPRLWLFVATVERQAGFVRLEGDGGQSGGSTRGAYWLESSGSPPDDDGDLDTVEASAAVAALEAAGVLAELSAWTTTNLNQVLSVRRVRLELSVWRNAGLIARLGSLGLARAHPRCWARLPTDALLLGSPSLSRPQREAEVLDDEVSSPRFPLAGPLDALEDLPAYYLPIGVLDRADVEIAADVGTVEGTALERDGLGVFAASLFVNPALAAERAALLGEAEHRYYVRELDLIGMHNLLPVGEVSLLAVPDAHHAGWTRQLPPQEAPLGAPELLVIEEPDENGLYSITWAAVDEATGYLVERDVDPDFAAAAVVYEGEATETAAHLEPGCTRRHYHRARARRYGELGPWSGSRQGLIPVPQFSPCDEAPPAELLLAVDAEHSPALELLTFEAVDAGATGADEYELAQATNADFIGATSTFLTSSEAPVPAPDFGDADGASEAHRFFRVRGLRGELRGPWSNTVLVEPTERVAWAVLGEAEYDDAVLLAVHRAMLRFAGARADLLAVLSLPSHYRTREAAMHVGKLTSGGAERLRGTTTTGVPALSFGESPVLGYGALVHPWLTMRVPDRGVDREDITVSVPADGAVLGSMAEVAIERGAWIAPANRVLQRVLALRPSLGIEDWRHLTPTRVNLVLRSPQGFVLFSQSTLSVDETLAPIHVRRLMILLRRLALREGDRFVFAPNDRNLRHLVRHRFEALLGNLYSRGAFAGVDPAAAFQVRTDESINPPTSVERGRFIVELRVAPARALAFITVRLVADERGRLAIEEV